MCAYYYPLHTLTHISEQQEMSNKTALCNLTENQYRAINLADGSTGLLAATICVLILAPLLLVLKKKAWESPVKRLNLALLTSIALSSLTFALAGFYMYTSPPRGPWCVAIGFFQAYWTYSILLYFNALLFALLLQVSAPIIPERWKHAQKYIPKAKYIEGIVHILIPIVTILINIPIGQRIYYHCDYLLCERVTVFYRVVSGILLALSIIIVFVTIIIFSCFCIKFYQTHVITKKTKWAMIRLSVVIIIVIFVLIYSALPARIEKFIYNTIIVMVVEVLLSLLFVILIYLPSTQCCKCHKRTPDQLPLLPNTDMHTNPPSEWDHSNVPSITVSVHPNEMSDCKSDYVSSLTIPAPKYGSTT